MQKLSETYKAVIYIRLSDADDKPGESDSVANQRKLIYDWLKNHPEIEVVAEKVDDGFSGLLFDRPAFKEMMGDIEAGVINCCVCKDLSRLGREHVEMGRYLRRVFPAYGVRFIAINEVIEFLGNANKQRKMAICEIYKTRRKAVFYLQALPILDIINISRGCFHDLRSLRRYRI